MKSIITFSKAQPAEGPRGDRYIWRVVNGGTETVIRNGMSYEPGATLDYGQAETADEAQARADQRIITTSNHNAITSYNDII